MIKIKKAFMSVIEFYTNKKFIFKKLPLIIIFLLFLIPKASNSYGTVNNKFRDNTLIDLMDILEERIEYNRNFNEYEKFLLAIGQKESSNKWDQDNNLPYWGYYQIGPMVRETLKVNVSWTKFKNDSILQNDIMLKNLKYNEKRIGYKNFNYFIGKKIKGIEITYSGLLAGAHIAGGGGIKKFLYTNGNYNPKDKFGTKISDYLKQFGGYNFNLKYL